jgi:invasion protein IalB
MTTGIRLLFVASLVATSVPPLAAQSTPPGSSKARPPADPNQKICQDITTVGSRLATKRICATRSEWEAKKRDDKDTVDQIQRSACMPTHNGGGGSPC